MTANLGAIDRRMFLAGAGAGALAAPFAASPLGAAHHASWPAVAQLAEGYVSDLKVANIVIAIGQGAERADIIARGPDSLGGRRPADEDSIYRIYSMTKPITGMAAMMLVEERQLGLDQPLAEILPKFAEMQVQKEYDGSIGPENLEPALRPITVRHLLTHSSGLGYTLVQAGPIAAAFNERGIVPGQLTRIDVPEIFRRPKPLPSLAEFADRLAEMPLVYQPGTRWSYSLGLDLMGRVIEIVTGMPFDRFLKERIFEPCGMASTGFRVAESEQYRLTTNYGLWQGTLLPVDPPGYSIFLEEPSFPSGGAGLVSTARDYDRFLQMVANYGVIDGRRVMAEAGVRLGTSDLFADTMDPADPYMRQWGFGAGGRVGKHTQRGVYGWAGLAGTIGFVDMSRGLRAGLYTQYMPSMTYPLIDELPAAILADLEEGPAA